MILCAGVTIELPTVDGGSTIPVCSRERAACSSVAPPIHGRATSTESSTRWCLKRRFPAIRGPGRQNGRAGLGCGDDGGKGARERRLSPFWIIELSRDASRDDVLDAFRQAPRIAFIRASDDITPLNSTAELMKELACPRGDMWKVALWEDILTIEGREAYYAYQVDNQAIVIPETIDAIRALSGRERDARPSIERTNGALGIRQRFI